MSLSQKRWDEPASASDGAVTALAEELNIMPALARVLFQRGIKESAAARSFLDPSLERLHSPWLMKGMERAVARICTALEKGEKIVVHGDYDVDGITAAALLMEVLRQLGAAVVDFYLPSRFREGYGLHREALEQIAAAGADLLITVDCGANASSEIACARSLGLDLIITDHHKTFEPLKGAAAVLNPLQEGCRYPFKDLSGAGIAFKLATALKEKKDAAFPEDLLDLAALGTAADMVPLLGENRILTAQGLARLRRAPRPGLEALAKIVGIGPAQIDSYALSFILAPPLNAAGRLGEADPALRLLLEQDRESATALAQNLHNINRERRDREARILREAEAVLKSDRYAAGEYIITLAGDGWPHGVIGIVASRLAERFYRPVVLIALDGDEGQGSARSIPGFDITAALHSCAPLLERFGGHTQAAGLTIRAERVAELRRELNRYAEPRLRREKLSPLLHFDAALDPPEIGMELARQVALLEPFGVANPPPLFCGRGWELRSWRLVGADQKHLKLNLASDGHRAAPIFFSAASLVPSLRRGRRFDLAFTLREGRFKDRPILDMVLKDLRRADRHTGGRVTVIDRRERRRLALLNRILRADAAPAVIFTATKGRRAELKEKLTAEQPLAFLGSGRDNYEEGSPAPACGYPVLVLYDLPLTKKIVQQYFDRCAAEGGLRIYLLYSEADRKRNDLLLNLALPSDDALGEIYRAWAEAATATGKAGLPASLRERFAAPAGTKFWERCLKIYAEAGLCRGGAPLPPEDLSMLGRSLQRSPAFQAVRELREGCFRYQEMLLKSSPGELAAAWDQLLEGSGPAKIIKDR